MAGLFKNPAVDPPRFPSPTKLSLHSRSPSRSPVRQPHARDTDPLLRDLSPTATLRAFRNDDLAQDQLGKSLDAATPAQRALGAKAAQACIDIRAWAREVEAWEWSGTFEVPEPVRKKQRMSSMSLGSLASRPSIARAQSLEDDDEEEFCGSLPLSTVQQYERRLDEIAHDLEAMDVEELKDFVLSAHSQASFGGADIDDSIGAIGADTNLRHLDDFTALITATILSALPFLSRLTRLLNTWHIRMTILRATPSYLHDLRQARTDLDHGWAALAVSNHPAADAAMKKSNASFTRDMMMEMKGVVSKQVHSLGKRLDAFLDELEGRQEVVPERWIEEFETLEDQYGSWVVQAERKVIEGEWAAANEPVEDDTNAEERPRTATTITTGPTVTTTTVGGGTDTSLNTSTHTTTSGPAMTTVTTVVQDSPRSESRGREVQDRPRHVPIVIDAYKSNPDQPTPLAELPPTLPGTKDGSISPLPRSNTPNSVNSNSSANVKKRAAFLNSEIEKGDGLIKSKPPPIVRPFEHASNAFTRLFKQKEGVQDGEDTAFGNVIRRKGSKDSGLLAKGSSSSLKGIMGRDKKDEKRDSGSTKASRLSSVSSSGSKKGSSSTGRPSTERMEYGDMARVPGSPIAEETKSRRGTFGSRKSPKVSKNKNSMEYGDMARMPEFERQEAETRSRSISFGKQPKPKSPTKDRGVMGYGDLVANPDLVHPESLRQPEGRPKSSKENRPVTPKDIERSKAKTAMEYGGLLRYQPPTLSDGAAKQQPDYLAPAPEPTDDKRTSRQNITALPMLQTNAKRAPETYKPSGLNSPFHSPIEAGPPGLDFPENWPLSNVPTPRVSPTKDIDAETGDVAEATEESDVTPNETDMAAEPSFGADVFDRQFIHTIPAQPTKRSVSRDYGMDETEILFRNAGPNAPLSGEVIPQRDFNDDEEDGAILWTKQPDRDRSWMKTGVSNTSRRLDWNEPPPRVSSRNQESSRQMSQIASPRPVSMVEEADEEDLSSANESEEEFGIKRRSDNAAAYFGGPFGGSARKAINSASVASRLQRSNSNPPVSPAVMKLREAADVSVAPTDQDRPDELFRRASTTSIESHPRSELKSIDIIKRNSVESGRGSAPVTPMESRRESVEESAPTIQSPGSPLEYKGGIVFPSPPSVPPRASSLNASPESAKKKKIRGELNEAVPKRKHPSAMKDMEPAEDNFDRHVSEVLDRVHAPIKFRQRPGAETPQPPTGLGGLGRPPARLPKAGEKKSSNMTLAPAEASPRKATPADPEVKLYHLTQAGRTEPIKLFVRLVGEGERVMVRVGGGWADLADYLRQYAEHHGSRTVSEGTLELQTATATNGTGAGNGLGVTPSGKRAVSGPAPAISGKSPITPLSVFPPLERPRTRDSDKSWLGREQPEFSMGDSDDSSPAVSPTVSQFQNRDIAPPRRSSLLSSRPSTAQSIRPTDASLDATGSSPAGPIVGGGPGGGLSLAGPSKAKAELPEQKARWVEGMLQQVGKGGASAEKSKEERDRYVAEMGKVGGVRRVAFRSSSAAGGGPGPA